MKIYLTTVVSIVIQFGIAILGWGGFAAFFSHRAFVALTIATILLSIAALFTHGNISPGEREDRGNRWVIAAFSVLAIPLAFFPAYTDRRDIWTIDGDSLRWIGFVAFVLGGILRLWPVFVLGRRFSGLVAIQKDHKLVTNGIYRYIRNPSYMGLLIGSVGWALTFRSGVGVLIVALFLIPLLARIRAEERLLADHFGAEYASYRARTWRLIPGVF